MALGAREILLVVRARNEASTVLNNVARNLGGIESAGAKMTQMGSSLSLLGTGIAGVGLGLLALGNSAVNSFVKFDTAARLTQTQINEVGVSLEEVKDISLRVASQIGVPFEQLQPALYDIFSSIDVSVKDAEKALVLFSKAGVAGMVDVGIAARGAFTIMNNFGLGIADLPRILDAQFKLVQQGIGTYEEVATQIGQLSQGADRAGQSIESMSGGLAFASRVTGSMAKGSTELKNVLNALGKTKVQDAMKAIGVSVIGPDGKFRQLKDIINDLTGAFSHLSAPEREARIQSIFKTGSTSAQQVTKFIGSATSNLDGFNSVMDEVSNNAGAMDAAFNKMNGPAAQMQLMKNRAEALKIEIGEKLLPVKLKLMETLGKLLDAWNRLSPKTQENIAKFAAIAAITAVVVGGLFAFVGVALMIVGAFASVGVGALALLGIFGGLTAGVGLLVAAFLGGGDGIKGFGKTVTEGFKAFTDGITGSRQMIQAEDGSFVPASFYDTSKFTAAFRQAGLGFHAFFEVLKGNGETTATGFVGFMERVGTAVNKVREIGKMVWTDIKEWWKKDGDEIMKRVRSLMDSIQDAMNDLLEAVRGVLDFIAVIWKNWGDEIMRVVGAFFKILLKLFEVSFDLIMMPIRFFTKLFKGDFQGAADVVEKTMGKLFDALIDIAGNIVSGLAAIFGGLGRTIMRGLDNAWEGIKNFFQELPGWIVGLLDGAWDWLFEKGKDILKGMLGGIVSAWDAVWQFFIDLPGKITGAIGDALSWIRQKGVDTLMGFLEGLGTAIGEVLKFFILLPVRIVENLLDAAVWLVETGKAVLSGMWQGIQAGWDIGLQFFKDLPGWVIGFFDTAWDWLWEKGKDILRGMWRGAGNAWDEGVQFLRDLPGRVIGFFNNAWDWLLEAGKDLLRGLWRGIHNGWDEGIEFFRGLPRRILDLVSDMRDLLFNSGKAVLRGFIDGIKSLVPDLGKELGNITDSLSKLKGPMAKDKKILFGSGVAVMGGFIRGIEAQRSALESVLGGVTSTLPSMVTGPIIGSTTASGGSGASVVVQPGAVQLVVQGNLDQSVMPQVGQMINEAMLNLADQMKRRRHP